MKVNLEYDEKLKEDEVVVIISPKNKKIDTIINTFSQEDADHVVGRLDDKIYLIDLENVECFYTYENGVVFFANANQYKVNAKLFEIQEKYEAKNFIRISKSVIVNIKKVEYLAPAFNRQLIFKLESGREEYSSRSYYSKIKNKLGV